MVTSTYMEIDKELSNDVYKEQLRICYSQLIVVTVGPPIAALVLTWIMYDQVTPKVLLWIWIGTVLMFLVLAPLYLMYRYQKLPVEIAGWRNWGAFYSMIAFCAGVAWGMGGWLLFIPQSLTYQLVIILFMYAAAAATMITTAAYRTAFISIMIPMLIPVCLRCLIEGTQLHYALSMTTVVYGVSLLFLHNNVHNALVASIYLRFENKELIRQLELQKAEAIQANAAKTHFLASASHDLRQPVHALGLFAEELNHRIKDVGTRQIFQKLEAALSSMRTMLDSLMDISRLDAGIIETTIQHFPVNKILKEVDIQFRLSIQEKGLDLSVMPSSQVVYADPALLSSIVHNLVSNAVRYTSSGKIVIGCRRCADALSIEVHDSGPGIAPEEQERIFQEFYQTENSERNREKGMGIGLAIAKRKSDLLRCSLKVNSKLGRGSIFKVIVPLGDKSKIIDASDASQKSKDISGALVLMIEDDAPILDGTLAVLRDWGCAVLGMLSIDDAIDFLSDADDIPDIILTDFQLGDGHTGVEAIKRIQTICGRAIPAILITGDTSSERLQEARSSRYPLLHKPVAPDELRALISHTLIESRKDSHADNK